MTGVAFQLEVGIWRKKINFFKKNKIATVILKWKILTQTTKWIYKEEKCQKQFTNEQHHLTTAIKAYKEKQRKIRILLLIKITKIMIKISLLQVLLMIVIFNLIFTITKQSWFKLIKNSQFDFF